MSKVFVFFNVFIFKQQIIGIVLAHEKQEEAEEFEQVQPIHDWFEVIQFVHGQLENFNQKEKDPPYKKKHHWYFHWGFIFLCLLHSFFLGLCWIQAQADI